MRKSFLKRYASKAALLLSAAALLSSCAAHIPTEGGDPWQTYLKDDGRTNVSADEVKVPLKKSWSRDISEFTLFKGYTKEQLGSPAFSGGAIFVGSTNETFYSLDMATGKTLWKFDAGYAIEAPPSVTKDRVCFGSSDGVMRCFERGGNLQWEYQARSEILSSPLIKDNKIFFASSDDRLYALDAATGEKSWIYAKRVFKTVTPRTYASPAWWDGKVYQFFSDGTLVCLSGETGKELWSRKLVEDFSGAVATRRTPMVTGGIVYAIDDNNAVLALNGKTGEVKGIYNIIKAHDFVLPDKDTIVIAGSDRVVAVSIPTGAILWDKALGKSPVQSIFAAGELLFVLSNNESSPLGLYFFKSRKGFIEALNLKDGSMEWSKKLGSPVSANGAAALSTVALAPDSGEFTLYTSAQ